MSPLETHQRRELVHIRVVDWIRRVPRSDFRNHALRLLPHTKPKLSLGRLILRRQEQFVLLHQRRQL